MQEYSDYIGRIKDAIENGIFVKEKMQKIVWIGACEGVWLFEIDPDTGEVSGIFHTRERIMNKIAYDPKTETMFVPTFANEIIAIREREK